MGLGDAIKRIIADEIGWSDRVIREAGEEATAWRESLERGADEIDPADLRAMKRFLSSAKDTAERINDYHAAKNYEKAMRRIDDVVDDSGKPRKKFFGLF